jgi:AraC family transcriptional regulator
LNSSHGQAFIGALPWPLAQRTCLRIPEQNYAVFRHSDHVSTIRSAWNAIWNSWLPDSDYETVDAPAFERYDEQFNSTTGQGGFELWIAIQAKIRGAKS